MKTKEDLIGFYTKRSSLYEGMYSSLKKKSFRLAILRLLVFTLIITFVYGFTVQWYSDFVFIILLITGFAGFLSLMKKHARINYQAEIKKKIAQVNQNELKALKKNFGVFNAGSRYNTPEHNYANDLDLFLEGGIYQFINRTTTIYGSNALAGSFLKPSLIKKEIEELQECNQDLSERHDLRQDFIAIGRWIEKKKKDNFEETTFSAKSANVKINKLQKLLVPAAIVYFVTICTLLGLDILYIGIFGMLILIPLIIAGLFNKTTMALSQHMDRQLKYLKDFDLLFERIEREGFTAKKAIEIKKRLSNGQISARTSIEELSGIIGLIDNRNNVFFWFFANMVSIWDVWCLAKYEAWEKKYLHLLEPWLLELGTFESLISTSNFAFNHQTYIYPNILEKSDSIIEGKEIGHPLVDSDKRVANDFELAQANFTIVTGANMAGKSTFLRTIGLNMVLARMGAPVCATTFKLRPVELITSMRTTDSLKSEQSYFHAELLRLKVIVDKLEKEQDIFIILDEILKGTNSVDKAKGSAMFIEKLVKLKATGIIATHDLSLCELANVHKGQIKNQCFEVEIEGDNIHFDYKLREGVAQQMNATYLMKKMNLV